MKKQRKSLWGILALVGLLVVGSEWNQSPVDLSKTFREVTQFFVDRSEKEVIVGNGQEQVKTVNHNQPSFSEEELSLKNGEWQRFSNLDGLNRVGEANAMLHKSMMPTEERERLYINPTGWKQKKMKNGDYLYNRCHLIGYQLTGENNNPKNLMTGTRSFNTPSMVEYENQIAEYLRKTGNHVRYRVTPDFRGKELVARGVQLEAQSIEDNRISFNVYIHNTQESYTIDYLTGSSRVTTKE
ncbi:DNA/RNA non-specific endonuclease [Enterococcus hirae]|nr:DNA/RNA non-specific endonuclease [Enterococcus hirae]